MNYSNIKLAIELVGGPYDGFSPHLDPEHCRAVHILSDRAGFHYYKNRPFTCKYDYVRTEWIEAGEPQS